MEAPSPTPRRRLTWTLAIAFAIAMIMGPGPGLYLINPEPGAVTTIFGIPVVYAWGLFWFAVQAGLLLTAYLKLWSRSEE